MTERVLGLAGDCRAPLAAHELVSLECVQTLLQPPPLPAEGAQPEAPAHDRSVLEQFLLLGGERVQAGGDDALDRLGQDDVTGA